jgi:hypothetical protein
VGDANKRAHLNRAIGVENSASEHPRNPIAHVDPPLNRRGSAR